MYSLGENQTSQQSIKSTLMREMDALVKGVLPLFATEARLLVSTERNLGMESVVAVDLSIKS